MARCDSYTAGECTWGACRYASWVQDGWGNAKDWWAGASRSGRQLSLVATRGAVVVFGPGHGYDPMFGHLGVVTRVYNPRLFQVVEMNYVRGGVYDTRDVPYFDIIDFILPPGVAPGAGVDAPGPPPPLGGQGTADLGTAWGEFSGFWNRAIEQDISGLWSVGGQIDQLSRS